MQEILLVFFSVSHCNEPGGGRVVVVVVGASVGQTDGPLVQLAQSLRPVQLVYKLHIPLEESNVKSVQLWDAAHDSWHLQNDSVMSEVRMVPVHRPLSKQSSHSVTSPFH